MDEIKDYLLDAIDDDEVSELSSVLQNHPELHINDLYESTDGDGIVTTLLCRAIYRNSEKVVEFLLSRPGIDVNLQSHQFVFTPLMLCCVPTKSKCFDLVLRHPGVDATIEVDGYNCIWGVCRDGYSILLRKLIASGIYLGDVEHDVYNSIRYPHPKGPCTAREMALRNGHRQIAELLDFFFLDPERCRHVSKVEYWMTQKELASRQYAVTIFLCDGLLSVKANTDDHDKRKKFFGMIQRLPMELQMLVCNLVYKSTDESILFKESEEAFRSLVFTLIIEESRKDTKS